MIKNRLIIFSICLLPIFIANKLNAQNTFIAKYNFTHLRDTSQPLNVYTEEMMLLTNNQTALYKSYVLFSFDSLLNNINSLKSNNIINVPKGTSEQIFTNYATNQIIIIRPWLEDTFGIKLPFQEINWKLLDTSIVIGTLKCNKAIGEFKGRIYTCWYCPEITTRSGPWKLFGLPGLIINASDEKNQISFKLNSIRQIKDVEINLPKNISYITENKFTEIKEAFLANPNAALGGDLQIGNTNFQKNGNGKTKSKLNNPLELN